MNCFETFKQIDILFDKYVSVWQDVCNIESPTLCKESIDTVGNYFIKIAKRLGFDIEILPLEKAGDVICITMNPHSKNKPLCFSGHMDTVHPKGIFGTPPVKFENDRILGPGVTDCKGGIVAALLAMEALSVCGYDKRPIKLLLQSDEEMGSRPSERASINYICKKSKDSVGFINLEGNGSPNHVCNSRKGILGYIFKITGKEAHSSECAILGASAILEASHKIIELEKFKDDQGITVNCGTIQGGTVANTIAGYCEFKANIRFATKEQFDFITNYVQKVADTVYVDGCSCKLEQSGLRIMMEKCKRNDDFIDEINKCLKLENLQELTPHGRKGGSDAADVTAFGTPCVDSIGVVGGYIHSKNEYAIVSSLKDSAKRLAAIATNIIG